MTHRHLSEDAGYSLPAVDDILDRGGALAWAELAGEIEREPYGPVADRVLRICAAHTMYGTSALWQSFVELVRTEAANSRAT
jgi:hypothetical protein